MKYEENIFHFPPTRSVWISSCSFKGSLAGHQKQLPLTVTHLLYDFLHDDHFQDNGYSELLVGISPDVPESPEIVEELKQLLTKASASLYRATRLEVCRIYKVFNFSHWFTYH